MWNQTQSIFLEALDRFAQTLVQLLPSLFAMALILALTLPFALLVRLVVRKLCLRLSLDARLREWGMAQPAAEGRRPPSTQVARAAGWTVMLLGLLLGLTVFEATTTSALALRLLEYLPQALIGLVILGVGLAGSRTVERRVLIGAVNMGLQSAHLLGLGARWLVIVLALAMALEKLQLGGTILVVFFGVLFGGIVLALALAVGLGAKDLVAHSLERHVGAPLAEAGGDARAGAGLEPKAAPPSEIVHHL